jgi:hypothetical protein
MMDADALPPVDLEALTANYGGANAVVARLLFIAEQAEQDSLKLDALKVGELVQKLVMLTPVRSCC